MKIRRKTLLAALAVGTSLLLAVQPASTQQAAPLTAEQAAQIVASPDRSAADRTNDQRRKPEQLLVFIGTRPGMTALDLSAGGGYTTELLARAIGPSGAVYGQSRPRDPSRPPTPPAAPEGNSHPTATPSPPPATPAAAPRPSPVALAERDKACTERRHQGRADYRSHPAVRRSRSARVGDRSLRSRDLDVQLSRPWTSRDRSCGHEPGGLPGAQARAVSTSSPIIRAGPAPASPRPAHSIASRRRSCARKSKRPASSWRRKGTSCAIPTIRATRTRRTRRSPRTNSC